MGAFVGAFVGPVALVEAFVGEIVGPVFVEAFVGAVVGTFVGAVPTQAVVRTATQRAVFRMPISSRMPTAGSSAAPNVQLLRHQEVSEDAPRPSCGSRALRVLLAAGC